MKRNINPLVSIIVPVYNVEQYLNQCIQLLIAQTYANIEIVLVDDGSTDSSGVICDSLSRSDTRIKVIHKTNGGLSDARNVGIESCKGDYLTCIDSDDFVTIDYVETLINVIIDNDSDISVGKIVGIYNLEQEKDFLYSSCKDNIATFIYSPHEALRIMLLENEFDVSACAKLYKRELFYGVQFPVGKLYEDMATTYKLIAKSKSVAYCKKGIYGYRQNRVGSITTENFNDRKLELLEAFLEFHNFIAKNYPDLLTAAECRYAACATGVLGTLYFSDERKNYFEIEKEMKKIIRKRFYTIFSQKGLLFRRKVKMIFAGLGSVPYKILYKAYYK